MSYLTTPRLVFSGKFQAAPSTVNNDPEHFDSATFQPNYQQPQDPDKPQPNNGWWNPSGSAAWKFSDCTVQQVVYRDGTVCDDATVDPIIGAAVNDQTGVNQNAVEAKLVDLDTQQQMVSEVWGLQVFVGQTQNSFGFSGNFEVAAFADIWVRYPSGGPDSYYSAFYQSVLDSIQWAGAELTGTGNSRFLTELAVTIGAANRLSIKFTVDGYDDDSSSPTFTFGRIVGSIGPYLPCEPVHFVAGRALQPTSNSTFNTAYAQIDEDMLSIDLGNSLPTDSAGGPLVDWGKLQVALMPTGSPPVVIGKIDYQKPDWYEKTAGIVSFPLSSLPKWQWSRTPLAIIESAGQGVEPLLAEAADGNWLRADQFVFRLNPGDKACTTFYMTTFGQPTANRKISLGYDASVMAAQTFVPNAPPGPQVVGEPESALTFPSLITTGADGSVELPLQAGDPGDPRQYIDGQVYGVVYGPGSSPPPVGTIGNPSQILNALVWSGYKVPDQPTWVADVQPIFQQYANLYPVMKQFVDLADFDSVVAKKDSIKQVFSTPVTNPLYMPVTRDLSLAKREMLLKWLDNPVYQ
jgi:hypothetical protein